MAQSARPDFVKVSNVVKLRRVEVVPRYRVEVGGAKARAAGDGQAVYLTLVEADGTSWSYKLTLSGQWQEILVPVEQLATPGRT